MVIDAHRILDVEVGLEREATEHIGDGVAPLFEIDTSAERIALVVVSDSAGSATALQFWSDARRTGVALASPERFPWCLANAPCGALARRFGVTGPNSTLLGEGEALRAALDTVEDLFAQGRVDTAMIVVACFASAGERGRAMALRLQRVGDERPAPDLTALRQACAPLSLRAAIDTVSQLLGGKPGSENCSTIRERDTAVTEPHET